MKHAQLPAALADDFAPWVQALDLQVHAFDADRVTLRLLQTDGADEPGACSPCFGLLS